MIERPAMKTPVVHIHAYEPRRTRPHSAPTGARIVALPLLLERKPQEKAAVQVAENEGMPPRPG